MDIPQFWPKLRSFYAEILNGEDFIASRRKKLRQRAGLKSTDKAVTWHLFI